MIDLDKPAVAFDTSQASAAKWIYILYLVGLVIPFATLAGLVWAYLQQGVGPEALRSHYAYQVRTFWLGLLYTVIGVLFMVVFIGYLILVASLVWWILRCVKGLQALERRAAVGDYRNWLLPAG